MRNRPNHHDPFLKQWTLSSANHCTITWGDKNSYEWDYYTNVKAVTDE